MTGRCRTLSALACVLSLLPAAVAAHPHVFIDGGLGFVTDEEGRLTHLSVVWEFDAFYSLFALQEEGMDPDGDGKLTDAEKARLAELFSQWIEGYEGDSYLWVDDTKQALSLPENATADLLEDGRIRMAFLRSLETPVDPVGAEIVAKTYDPTYYTYYAITEPPEVVGGGDCTASHEPVELDDGLATLQTRLLDYDPYQSPEDPEVGRLFADTIRLTCAPQHSG